MAKKNTLEELNQLVAKLAEDYKQAERDLADAFISDGDSPESQETVRKTLATKKSKLWRDYQKYKKQQLAARTQTNDTRN